MSEQVAKVLQMTRLEAGAIALERDWASIAEIAGTRARPAARAAAGAPRDRRHARRPAAGAGGCGADRAGAGQSARECRAPHAARAPSSACARKRARPEIVVSVEDYGAGLRAGDIERVFEKFQRGAERGRPAAASASASRSAAPSCACTAAAPGPSASRRRHRVPLHLAARRAARPRPSGARSADDGGRARHDPGRRGRAGDPALPARVARRRRLQGRRIGERAGAARSTPRTHKPDLAIVDLGLPDIDGLEVIRRIREWSPMPIIVLSARAQERAKIEALDAGADDYVTKPFGVGELLARVRVALRHAARAARAAPCCARGRRIDLEARRRDARRQRRCTSRRSNSG